MTRAERCRALFGRVVDPPAVRRSFECWTEHPPNAYLAAIEACEEADETAPVAVSALPEVEGPIATWRAVAAACGVNEDTIAKWRPNDAPPPLPFAGPAEARAWWRGVRYPAPVVRPVRVRGAARRGAGGSGGGAIDPVAYAKRKG